MCSKWSEKDHLPLENIIDYIEISVIKSATYLQHITMQPLINIIPNNYYASYICYNSYLQIGKKFNWLLLLEVAIFTSYCILQLSIFRYTLRNCIKQQSLSLGMLTFRKVIQTHKKHSNATITSGFVRKKHNSYTITLQHHGCYF